MIGLFLLCLLFGAPFLGAIGAALTYRFNERRLRGLVLLYLAIALLYADAYFLLILAYQQEVPIQGIHPIWTYLPFPEGRTMHLSDVSLAFVVLSLT